MLIILLGGIQGHICSTATPFHKKITEWLFFCKIFFLPATLMK